MTDLSPAATWADVLSKSRRKLSELRKSPAGLFKSLGTPIRFDTGRPPGNVRLQGILTLLAWVGLLVGGIATLITAFFTTGTTFLVLAGITVVSLLRVVYEYLNERKHRGPWAQESEVVTGCLLVANSSLYEPGSNHLPGGMLVTFDAALNRDPLRLRQLTEELMAYYEESGDAPVELRAAIAWIGSGIESASFERMLLPRSFTGNDSSYLVCMGLDQVAMPNKYLDRNLWPLFGRADKNEPLVLMPHKLWFRGDPAVEAVTGADSA